MKFSVMVFLLVMAAIAVNDDAISLYDEAQDLIYAGLLDAAIQKLSKAIEIAPNYYDPFICRAGIYEVQGNECLAQRCIQ